jgi:bifunctional DNA-binding transcriptional regulator/antitoxin component of YhaV-PrlF toxin-antitoxin module
VEERRVDSQGRLILPPDWRREEMAGEKDVYIIKRKGYLKILPKRKVELGKLFDELDLGVDAIGDWGEFERRLHGG